MEYREDELNARIRLMWSTSDRAMEIVPASRLSTAPDGPGGDGLSAVYRSQQRYLAFTTRDGDLFAVTYEWPARELAMSIPRPPDGTRISLLGHDGTLPWRYAADTLYVDVSGITYQDMPCEWAWAVRLEGYARVSDER